ncbi:hypothetical protein QAO71_17515 (plasmid) [Halopseudomonas sp. SMJS2]|uniref:hypothetical protein n=1 Tax=Halopseudomonas sp. SMJS2 TaxID=3041098 RepID=UPI00245365F0|nr:hypothetical protein [Halopseudomonas sp. SMJS2]WGK63340.1 hypothetical protein QAO71_17515 [Halopseudomonas sp. SMJS2]
MSLKEAFNRSKHLGELASAWMKHLRTGAEAAGAELPYKITEGDVASLIAPAALLANIILKEGMHLTHPPKRVLILGGDPITRLDRSIWMGYANQFLGIPKSFEIFQLRDEDPRSNLYETGVALGLQPSTIVAAQDLLRGEGPEIEIALWIHPVAETPEHDASDADLAAMLHAQGIPVYSCHFNELDLHVQNYALNTSGISLAPLGQVLSSGSMAVNRFGISSQSLGITGGWGALLAKAEPAKQKIPRAHIQAVVAATTLLRSQGYETSGWTFGTRINGVAFNRVLPIALLGNMAVDDRYGYVLSEHEKPRILNVSGHAWSDLVAEMPKSNFNLLYWASRLKLCFNTFLPKEPKRRTEVIDTLTSAYQLGALDAGIALARGYESLKTEKGTSDAIAIYQEIGAQHPMSSYVLAHHEMGNGNSGDAEGLMNAAAEFGYPPAVTDLGVMAFQSGKTAQGLALLKKAMALGDSEAAFSWAEIQIQQGAYVEALEALRKAWATGHEEALKVAQWLATEMLQKGLGKRSVVKRELKDIVAFVAKRKRLEEQAAASA